MPGSTSSIVRGRVPGTIVEAACWAHDRRKLFVLADLAEAPLAIEVECASLNNLPSSACRCGRTKLGSFLKQLRMLSKLQTLL